MGILINYYGLGVNKQYEHWFSITIIILGVLNILMVLRLLIIRENIKLHKNE
jgi:hypothetical protein